MERACFLDKVADVLSHTRQVVIDFSGVEMIDGAGLGELVAIFNYADARGCSVKLAAPNRMVYSLLKLTHLTSLFEIHPYAGCGSSCRGTDCFDAGAVLMF